jgi:succinate-semialdehyde dehydrogenase/glutarate-semialdehyde dehydrogenase
MADLMIQYKDDLATIITLEAGKPFAEAKGEVLYAVSFYEFYAEEAKRITGEVLPSPMSSRRLLTIKQPVGPAALITPWNFPSAMITRKVGPALAAGCTVVIKPAEATPLSALALCAIAEEAGLPAGVMNCLTVAREDVEEVGQALCRSQQVRKVSFTGSTAVGKWLMRECASTVKRVKSTCCAALVGHPLLNWDC